MNIIVLITQGSNLVVIAVPLRLVISFDVIILKKSVEPTANAQCAEYTILYRLF